MPLPLSALPPIPPDQVVAILQAEPPAAHALVIQNAPLCVGPDACVDGSGFFRFAPEPVSVLPDGAAGDWPRAIFRAADGVALLAWLSPEGLAPMVTETTTLQPAPGASITLAAGLALVDGQHEDARVRFSASPPAASLGFQATPDAPAWEAPVGWRQGWATGGPLYTAPDGSAAPLAWLRSGEPIAVHRSGPDSAAPGWERVQLTGPHYALQGYLPQSRLPPRPAQRARPVSHAASGGFGWAGPMVRPVVHEVPAQARLYDAPGGAVVGFVPAETTLRQGEGSQRGWVSLTVWLPGWGAVPVWAPADTLGTTYDPFVASLPTRTSLYAEGDCARSVLDKRRGTLSRRTGADEAGVHIVYAGAGWFNLSSAYQRTHHPDGSESLSALGEAWTELLELRPDGSFVLGGQVWHRSRSGCLAASERP